MTFQSIAAGAGADVRVNDNFDAVAQAGVFGKKNPTTSSLTWGYYGGNYNGNAISDGTVALTASATNYVVALQSTGVVSASTSTTNWNNTSTYLQLHKVVTGTATITSWQDFRPTLMIGGIPLIIGGSTTQIQYNNSGALAGSANFTWDNANSRVNTVNLTATGLVLTAASAAGGSGFRLPHGAAPTSPTNGDVWTTTAGLYAQINGSTVGPFASSAGTLTNPMTTSQDIIVGGSAGAPTRLGVGANYQSLTVVGGAVTYAYTLIPQNSQSAAYTLVAADQGAHILHPSADTTARTFTIPANSSVAYPIGTAITFVNQNAAGVITIAITTDTMRLAVSGSTGSRTLAPNGVATALKITSTEWIISGSGLT
jgi:hypothetical protein